MMRRFVEALSRPRSPGREAALALAVLSAFLVLTLFPFVLGDRTLQDSASISGAGSLYSTGSKPVYHEEVPRTFDPWAPALQAEPHFALEHHILFNEKTAPLWNPYSAYGEPLAAGMIAQPYSPFAWIAVVWNSARGYTFFIFARMLAAGFFTFLFLRRFLGFMPALAGGIAFMYAGDLWLYLSIQDLSVDVLLPALLYAAEMILEAPGWRYSAVLAVILSVTILGGHPEPVVLSLAFTAAFVAARVMGDAGIRTRLAPIVGFGTIGCAIGAGLSAVFWLPVLEYVPQSFNLHTALPWGSFTDAFEPVRAAQYLAPLIEGPLRRNILSNFGGEIYLRGFFGGVAAFFALVAFCTRISEIVKRRVADRLPVLFFGATALLLLLKRFGFPIVNLIGYLPIFWRVYFTKYEEPVVACCVAILVGYGVSVLSERRAPRWACWVAGLLPLGILAIATATMRTQVLAASSHHWYFVLSVLAAMLFLALTAALFLWAPSRYSYVQLTFIAIALIFLEPVTTYIFPLYYVINTPVRQSDSTLLGAPYIQYLKTNLHPEDRVLGEDGMLFPNWAAAFQIPDITALDALYPTRYLSFVQNLVPDQQLGDRYVGAPANFREKIPARFLTLSSVRFVIVPYKMDQFSDSFSVVHAEDGAVIYSYQDSLPRLSVFSQVAPVASGEAALQMLKSAGFDPRREAVIEGAPADFADIKTASSVRAGRVDRYESRYVRATVEAPAASMAVLTDTAFPGWNAYVDGTLTPIYRANYLFRGVRIPRGRHTLEFRYEPSSFRIGGILSLLSLIGLVIMLLVPPLISRRKIAR